MATRNAATIIDAKLAASYYAAPKTKQKQALAAFRQALQEPTVTRRKDSRLSKEETALLLKINRTLPDQQARRLEELNEKIEETTLTDAEQAELLSLAKRVERLWVARLQAIIELAQLRNLPPAEMLRRLEIEPPAYAQ